MSSSFFSSEEDGKWKYGNSIDWGDIELDKSKQKKNCDSAEWDDFSFRSFDHVAAKTSPLKSKADTRIDEKNQSQAKKGGSKNPSKSSSSKKKSISEDDKMTKLPKQDTVRRDKDRPNTKDSSPSPKKRESSRKVEKESSGRKNLRSPSIARREKAHQSARGDESNGDARKEKSTSEKESKPKKEERKSRAEEKDSQRQKSPRDASKTPLSRRHSSRIDERLLSQSRQRSVQRAEARNSWRETHGGAAASQPKGKSKDSDDLLDAKRSSLLDQSRRGPMRSSSVHGRSRAADNDEDDFSVLSGTSSSSFMVHDHLDAPFPSNGLRRSSSYRPGGGGSVYKDDHSTSSYLPSFLSNTNPNGGNGGFQKQERRPSAFGTGQERAQAIYSLKHDLDKDSDDDDDESCSGTSVYSLPNGLARSNGSHFEIDRSSKAGASARRPSLSTVLTIPCVNGVEDDNDSADPSNKVERRGSMSSNLDPASNKKGGANYDSTVEDMLKNRRLRGARGDAAKKKKDENVKKKERKLSMRLLSNLVQSTLSSSSDKPDSVSDCISGKNSGAIYTRRPSSVV
jgi:hypothetical protein